MNRQPIISIESARDAISALKSQFDSHDFITVYILSNVANYLGLLRKYGSVDIAHQQIGAFLSNYASELGINKQDTIESENIFGEISECALWEKVL